MYEVFELLLKKFGITAYKFCKDTGVSQSTIYTWKKKHSLVGPEIGRIIANYFGVTIDYLMTGKEESPEAKKPALSNNEELNVINDVDEIMKRIRNNETVVLRFNGEDYSGDEDEDKLLRDSLLSLCRAAKIKKKQEGFGE